MQPPPSIELQANIALVASEVNARTGAVLRLHSLPRLIRALAVASCLIPVREPDAPAFALVAM
jgi:hypothetical protein